MKPFFSIIVPCCDVEQYVRESLDSVLNQSFTDWECLIGVETSKDKTEEIVRAYEAKDPRFKVFTGPRSGSCSASRNVGIDRATGEYIIFLDGDDTIVEGSLQRLHDKIAARPGADLYPCAIQVYDDSTGENQELRENYPNDAPVEMTGAEATIFIAHYLRHPEPMMQLTICRREFLVANSLRCIVGLRGQDREFTPRALYLANRVVPTHEIYYLYRKRPGAITTSVNKGLLLDDQATIHKSLIAFFGKVSKSSDFDKRVAESWCRSWVGWMIRTWFDAWVIKAIPRSRRVETLRTLFSDGFNDFNALIKCTSLSRRIAGWWFCAFVKVPYLRFVAELFFICYSKLSNLKCGNMSK